MHETFLVIRVGPSDMGNRPLTSPFVTPDLSVGSDGRPRVLVWNLGTREIRGVVTEFAAVPAGAPIHADNCKTIGYGNPAHIQANGSVLVTCTSVWSRMSSGDVLLAMTFHPEMDTVKMRWDPIADRHVGQMNYPWAGTFEGMCGGPAGTKVSVHIRPANQGLFKIRLFYALNGRLPTNPQIDRQMAPSGVQFRWQESGASRKAEWELTMLDNQRLSIRCKQRLAHAVGQEISGTLTRLHE